eukprot:TRINITY_DN9482_c0_g1_i1.p1 TRINITY_DN9482_c0_g1~~TRINITY_DN9482_c0_g1_i1.p1  ORF type:complete len:241 (+),score=40.63 TRINITY_DN9482_c0_g1_i1:77-799(+)
MMKSWTPLVLFLLNVVAVSCDYSPNRNSIYCPSHDEGYCATTGVCCKTNDRCTETRHYGDDGCVDEWTVARIWWMFMCIAFFVCTCGAVLYYCRRRRYVVASSGPGGVPVIVNESGDVQMVQVVQAQPASVNQQYPPVLAPTGHMLYPMFLPDGRPIYPVDVSTGIPCIPAGIPRGPDGQPSWPPIPTGVVVAGPHSSNQQGGQQMHPPPPPPLSVVPSAPVQGIVCHPAPLPPSQQQQV